MNKFCIEWKSANGEWNSENITSENHKNALEEARERWRDENEDKSYSAVPVPTATTS